VSTELETSFWPAARLGEALELLARRAGYRPHAVPVEPPPAGLGEAETARWVEAAARWLGVDAEPVEAPYAEAGDLVRGAAPALLRIDGAGGPRFLALARGGRRTVTLLGPDLAPRRVSAEAIRAAVGRRAETPVSAEAERLLDEAGVAARRRPGARAALLRHLLADARVGGCWLVRPGEAAPLAAQLGGSRFTRRIVGLLGAHAFQYVLFVGSWWLMGWIALTDRFDPAWLFVWLLLFGTVVSLRLFTYVSAGRISLDLGAHLKRRLLEGAFRLDPDEVRHRGAGQLLGCTMEVEAIESFTFLGALLAVMAVVELVFAGFILRIGAGGGTHVLLLAAWAAGLAVIGTAYYRERARWTGSRLAITDALVEEMVGHRTRTAQEPRGRWSERDDQALERYHAGTRRMDRWEVVLEAVVPRGWFLVGLAALIPSFVAGRATGGALAAGIGGVLIGYRAFRMLGTSLEQLTGALVAWRRIAPLLAGSARAEPVAAPNVAVAAGMNGDGGSADRVVLDARGLAFRHPGRAEPVLRGADVRIAGRDRVLLEGPSGGGKSTLGTLLATCRTPDAGLLLLGGLDPATVGHAEWRRRVVFVPQFHENHVLMGSFAFNVLMGRGWPPSPADLRDADRACRGLGLGPLLDRMPGGLFQMVGETGWQLSHGERSRLFVARAVLQHPDVLILDESFAALDPETLRSTLEYLFAQDAALIAIAHP
jgi:ATP-binding cassette subfamily B protein